MTSPRMLSAAVLMGLTAALPTGAGADPGLTGEAAARIARPTEPGSPYAFETTQVRRFAGRSVIVHYVTRTEDAPGKADADGDGTPDYVELVAGVADTALAFYARPVLCQRERCADVGMRPFRRPLADAAGPNGKPDVYLKAGLAGSGLAISNLRGAGGGFVMIDPRLDTAPGRQRNGINMVLPHELFHLVEFAYVPRGAPAWISEGAANAMASEVSDAWDIARKSGPGRRPRGSAAVRGLAPEPLAVVLQRRLRLSPVLREPRLVAARVRRAQPPPAHLRSAGGAATRPDRRRHRRDQSGARRLRHLLQRAYARRRSRRVLG